MKLNRALSLAIAVFAAPTAVAQVVPVGPFGGHAAEGFEIQQPAAGSGCLAERVFMDLGDLCTPQAAGATVVTSWTFLCALTPHSGSQFYGSSDGKSVYRFDRRAKKFGGYFASNATAGTVNVRFFDAGGQLIDDVVADVTNDCTWTWNGWEAPSASIKRVQVINSSHGGAFVMMDDMQIDFAELGNRYCVGAVNSTGEGARISAVGSTGVMANNLILTSACQPPMSAGLFYYGGSTSQIPLGEGFRCVRSNGSGIQRFPLTTADVSGVMRTNVNYGIVVNPPMKVLPGSTWHFQAMYRDPAGGGTMFNFSDAVTLLFGP